MIETVNENVSVNELALVYEVDANNLSADNGLVYTNNVAVSGQGITVVKPSYSYVPLTDTTVEEISERFQITQKSIFRNNYILGGKNRVPAFTSVVLEKQNKPEFGMITGGYAYDFISVEQLDSVINYLTYIIPFTYGFSPDGSLVYPNDEYIIKRANEANVKKLMHLSTLTSEGNFDSNLPTLLFANEVSVENLLNNVTANVAEKGYDGIDVDFEFLNGSEKENYVDFVRRLSERMRELGKITVVALPPKTSDDQRGQLYEGIDYAGLGKYADYVLAMTYEWGYKFGTPLAVAPVPSVRRVLDYAVTRIPKEKLLLGISNYGYDWKLPFERGETVAETLSTVRAQQIALENNAVIQFDEIDKAPYFFYTDGEGIQHEVWFEDARSFEAKIDLIGEYGLPGGFIWELTRENPSGFTAINSLVEIY